MFKYSGQVWVEAKPGQLGRGERPVARLLLLQRLHPGSVQRLSQWRSASWLASPGGQSAGRDNIWAKIVLLYLPEINQQPQALFTELQGWVQLIKSRLGCICQLDDKKYFHCFLWNSANFLQFQGTLLFSFISGPIKHWAFSPSPHGPKSLFQKRWDYEQP